MPKTPPKVDETTGAAKQRERAAKKKRYAAASRLFNDRFRIHAQRGIVLSVVANLDEKLKEAVQLLMVDDTSIQNAMFRETGPLGSYASRARLGYLMGLYERDVLNDLIHIGHIRNLFAHRTDVSNFFHQEVIALCEKIQTLDAVHQASQDPSYTETDTLISFLTSQGYDLGDISYRFLIAVPSLGRFIIDEARNKRLQMGPDIHTETKAAGPLEN